MQNGGGTGTKHPILPQKCATVGGALAGSPASLLSHNTGPWDRLQELISSCSVEMCRRSGAAAGDGLSPKWQEGGLISETLILADKMALG